MYYEKIRAFAAQMTSQFSANLDRGGWRGRPQKESFDELHVLVQELEKLVHGGVEPGETLQETQARILAAAADIANVALIVAENAGALPVEMSE